MSSSSNSDEDLHYLEQLRAKGVKHKKPLSRPARKRQIGVESMWNCFKEEKKAWFDQPDFTLDVQLYKVFFRWYAKNAKELFGPRPTISSILATVGIFCSILGLKQDERDNIKNYVTEELDSELGLTHACRPKRLFMAIDMELLHDFLFCKDSHKYRHQRYSVQLAFDTILLEYSAARPGAINVSSAHQGSNQALLYRDVKLLLKRPDYKDPNLDQTHKFFLNVTFRLLKGMRDIPSSFLQMSLKENRERPLCCPITMFMALAFGDGAFEHYSCPKDLLSYSMPPNCKKVEITIRPEFQNSPILRMAKKNRILPDKAWTCEASASLRGRLSIRAGFRYHVRPYDIRRASANQIHAIASESQQDQILGHYKGTTFTKKYLSQHVLLDVQGHIDKGCREDHHVLQMLSQSIEQRDDAPSQLPTELSEEVKNNETIVGLRCAMNDAWQRFRNAVPGVFSGRPATYLKTKIKRLTSLEAIQAHIDDVGKQTQAVKLFNDVYNAFRAYDRTRSKLTRQKLTAFREDWFKQANAHDALYRPPTDLASTPGAVANHPLLVNDKTPSTLYELFHPASELKSLSLELIEALTLVCDPGEQPRKGISCSERPRTRRSRDGAQPQSKPPLAVETPRADREPLTILEGEYEARGHPPRLLDEQVEEGRHSFTILDKQVDKGRHFSKNFDDKGEEGEHLSSMLDKQNVEEKGRSAVAREKSKSQQSVALGENRKATQSAVAGEKRKAQQPVVAQGENRKAKRSRIGKKLISAAEDQCLAILG